MDVDNTVVNRVGQTHSDDKMAQLRQENKCFYCKIKGHRANVCRKKIADRAKQGTGGMTGKVTTTVIEPEQLAQCLKDSMGILDEETKLSIIDTLMPPGFVQGPN